MIIISQAIVYAAPCIAYVSQSFFKVKGMRRGSKNFIAIGSNLFYLEEGGSGKNSCAPPILRPPQSRILLGYSYSVSNKRIGQNKRMYWEDSHTQPTSFPQLSADNEFSTFTSIFFNLNSGKLTPFRSRYDGKI